ncbi:MAG TPA: enoyl-CoA hydratase [Dehalococcoidia bacterium]|nr:enoyl-CoA hydratase [Dehalococcoidia bacterium]|tara:strand:+ start:308 stop:778 length:471 start_codon:yes stop_codon:yes gene_type:complete
MSIDDLVRDIGSRLGEETHCSDWLEITQETINGFAEVTQDRQWIHVDVERAAKESPFKGTVAHGFLTLSLIPFLTGSVDESSPPYEGVKLTVNYGLNRVRFPNPVPPGSRVRSRSKLAAVEKVGEEGIQVVTEVTIEIEGQPKPACVAETVFRYYF